MNKTVFFIIASLVSVIAGVTAFSVFAIYYRTEATQENISEKSVEIVALEQEISTLMALIEKQKAHIVSLEDELVDRNSQVVELQKAREYTDQNVNERSRQRQERREQMREFIKRDRITRINSLLMTLTDRLALSPEQAEILTSALDQWLEKSLSGDGRGRGFFRGPFSGIRELQALDDTLSEILSPEQIAIYNDFREEQRTTQVEAMANRQLMDLQNSLSLSDEQKDIAFQAFADLAWERMNDPKSEGQFHRPDEEILDRTVEAMGEILTPEQLEIYLELLENRRSFFRRPPPEAPPGGGQ